MNQPDLADIMTELANAGGPETMSFGDIIDAFGQRVFGPMLMVPAFIAVAPTGAIPGMSLLTGAVIALVAVQLLFQRRQPWLPDVLTRASLSKDTLKRSVKRADPYVERIDALIKPRLTWLTVPPLQQVLAAACIIMALTMFPLALLPFAVAVPGTAVLLVGIGLATHDGYFAAAGLGLSVLALSVMITTAGWIG